MKTIVNRSSKPRTLARTWDEDTGAYSYFFLTTDGQHRARDPLTGKFHLNDIGADKWTQTLGAGESVTVPTSRETYHQTAMRTGEMNQRRNRQKSRA